MKDELKEIFGQVRAEEALKKNTRIFLEKKMRAYAGVRARRRRYALCAACACLLLFCWGSGELYFTKAAEISIDINPSIELGINRFDRVISVNGFNEDGWELTKTLDVKYKNYMEAIEQIGSSEQIAALLAKDEIMTITIIDSDGTHSAKLFSDIEAYTKERKNTHCYLALSEEVATAHEMELSCGKYKAFLEAQSLDENITPEMVRDMTMREIRALIDGVSAGDADAAFPYPGCGNGRRGNSNSNSYGNSYGNRK